MIPFTQENINKLTDYILGDEESRKIAITGDWRILFEKLLSNENNIIINILDIKETWIDGFLGFLYQYFINLDNFNVLELVHSIPVAEFGGLNINEITIPGNIKVIHRSAFTDSKLREITLEEGVGCIAESVFAACEDLISINLPGSLKYIGMNAFVYCDSLTTINYNGTKDDWEAIEKDEPIIYSDKITIHCTDGEIKF